jgi:hypothetical protein
VVEPGWPLSLSSKGPHGDLRLKDADWIMEGVT